jgi:hypothetical protein
LTLIRKLSAIGAGVAALCAVTAFALAPVSALAEGSHPTQPEAASTNSFTPSTATTPSAACVAARDAITAALAKDRSEDVAEKAAPTIPASDLTSDATEKSETKALRTQVHTACAGQPKTPPTAACLAAKQAVKDAQTAEKGEDTAEKSSSTEKSAADQSEDKKEAVALKPIKDAQHTACSTTTK